MNVAPSHRVSIVKGQPGTGTTNFVKFVAKRFYERHTFNGGVLFIDQIGEKQSPEKLMQAIINEGTKNLGGNAPD